VSAFLEKERPEKSQEKSLNNIETNEPRAPPQTPPIPSRKEPASRNLQIGISETKESIPSLKKQRSYSISSRSNLHNAQNTKQAPNNYCKPTASSRIREASRGRGGGLPSSPNCTGNMKV
jgi:hypothetical protein